MLNVRASPNEHRFQRSEAFVHSGINFWASAFHVHYAPFVFNTSVFGAFERRRSDVPWFNLLRSSSRGMCFQFLWRQQEKKSSSIFVTVTCTPTSWRPQQLNCSSLLYLWGTFLPVPKKMNWLFSPFKVPFKHMYLNFVHPSSICEQHFCQSPKENELAFFPL